MKNWRIVVCLAVVVIAQMIDASSAQAQGCIVFRQTSPMFGTTGAVDQEVGGWTLTFTTRSSIADKHYNGTVRQIQREREGTYVVNRQNSLTANLAYQLTPRISLNAALPFVEASWGIPSPRTGGPAARANGNARGIGDVTALARMSVLSPTTHRSWNIQVGGGLKLPTGENAATDVYPDNTGNNNVERYVDISVHPGDGGWGVIFDLQGYKAMGRFTAFGSSSWLANPRNTGTASRGNLKGTLTPTNVNTVSDQFAFRLGTSVGITHSISASIAWRAEGVPRYDLLGRSDGFRRPGVEMYWEPGISYMAGSHSFSFNLPIGYYFNRFRNPYTGNPGDSTFPEYVAIATYSVRLGKKPPMMDHTPPVPGTVPARPGVLDQQEPTSDAE